MLSKIGPGELILVLIIALVIFGPAKLPELGQSMGQAINEFKKASSDDKTEVSEETNDKETKES